MPAAVHLIRGIDARSHTDRCRAAYLDSRDIGSALWIAPTERVRDEVLASLVRQQGTLLAANVVTFPELARMLAEPLPPARILPESHQRLLLDGLLEQLRDEKLLKFHREMVGRPGFGDAVFSLISELQGQGISPSLFESTLRSLSEHREVLRPKDAELALVYARYVLLLNQHQWLDRAAIYARAAERLNDGLPLRFAAVRTIIVDGFSELTPPQYAVLQELARHVSAIWIALLGDSERIDLFHIAEQTAVELRNRLDARDDDSTASPTERPAGLEFLVNNNFYTDVSPSKNATGLALIEAPALAGEVTLVARAVKKSLLAGNRPESILISARRLTEYVDLLRATFDEFGIPIDLDGVDSLASHPAVATLLAAANLADSDFPFDETTWLLRSTWFAPTWPEAGAEMAIDAELLLRCLGEPRGRDNYLTAAHRHAERVADGLEDEEAAGAKRRQLHELAKRCEPFLKRFFAAWDNAPQRATVSQHADWLQKLADEFGIAAQATVLERLWHELERWSERERQWQRSNREFDRGDFLRLAGSLAAAAGLPRSESGLGRVRIVPAELAVGLTYEHLFLLGLGERGFPSPAAFDPLYDEAERQALHGAGAGLQLAAERLPSEMLLFYRLLSGASQSVTLSFPAVDAKGQELLPGSFLRAARGLFQEHAVPVTSRKMAVENLDSDRPLSQAEYRVRFAIAGGNGEPLGEELTKHLAVAKAIAASRDQGTEFGPFDGLLNDPTARAEVARRLGPGRSFSATALEQFVECPFKFFINQVLKLSPLDEPAEEVEAHRRGNVYHRALARVHRKNTDQSKVNELLSAALKAAVAEEADLSSSPVLKKLWELENNRLQRISQRYAKQWAAFCDPWIKAGLVLQPKSCEQKFVIPLDGFQLHGTIDRIDAVKLADGSTGFWVIDYKTGKKGNYTATAVKNLLKLQLGIYALAAEQQHGRPLGMTYWSIFDGVKIAMPGRAANAWLADASAWNEYRAQLLLWLKEIIRCARAGEFRLAPRADESCNHCSCHQSCRISGRRSNDRTWTLTLGDAT